MQTHNKLVLIIIMLLYLVLHNVSHSFDKIQIRWIWKSVYNAYIFILKLFSSIFCCVLESIVLHEEEILFHSHSVVYNRYNMLTIELLVDFISFFLSEYTEFFRWSRKTFSKHSFILSWKIRHNTNEIVLFVKSSSDSYFAMMTVVDSRFITSQYSLSLFLDSVKMLVCSD